MPGRVSVGGRKRLQSAQSSHSRWQPKEVVGHASIRKAGLFAPTAFAAVVSCRMDSSRPSCSSTHSFFIQYCQPTYAGWNRGSWHRVFHHCSHCDVQPTPTLETRLKVPQIHRPNAFSDTAFLYQAFHAWAGWRMVVCDTGRRLLCQLAASVSIVLVLQQYCLLSTPKRPE